MHACRPLPAKEEAQHKKGLISYADSCLSISMRSSPAWLVRSQRGVRKVRILSERSVVESPPSSVHRTEIVSVSVSSRPSLDIEGDQTKEAPNPSPSEGVSSDHNNPISQPASAGRSQLGLKVRTDRSSSLLPLSGRWETERLLDSFLKLSSWTQQAYGKRTCATWV